MKIVNGKGTIEANYKIEVEIGENYVSVDLFLKVKGMKKRVFIDNHAVIGNNPDMLLKSALVGAENKWDLELLKLDFNSVVE